MKLVLALAAVTLALIFTASAGAMRGQMRGQAALSGTLSNQTVQVSGSLFFNADEDNAVVCLVLTQNGNKATGCSQSIGYAPGEVMFPATLTGSGLIAGPAALRATVKYAEDGKTKSWTWNNPGFMLVN